MSITKYQNDVREEEEKKKIYSDGIGLIDGINRSFA
jgi:hypothetical protein